MRLGIWALVRIAAQRVLGFSGLCGLCRRGGLCFFSLFRGCYLGAAELPGGDAAQACRTNRISAPPSPHGTAFAWSSMRSPCRRGQPRVGAHCLLLCLLLGAALSASVPPLWWRKGRARKILGSRAEAELLCQLAVLLMPDVPIAEAFRDFPVEKSEAWGSSRLSPDLTAYGVLKATDAALFIEYDGHYRHMEPAGLARDMRKTTALLKFAPAGSCRSPHRAQGATVEGQIHASVGGQLVCWAPAFAPEGPKSGRGFSFASVSWQAGSYTSFTPGRLRCRGRMQQGLQVPVLKRLSWLACQTAAGRIWKIFFARK